MGDKQDLIASLQDSIRGLESAGRADDDGPLIRSGCAAMDFTLPDGGYRRGSLIEWIATSPSSGGSGIDYLSLQTAWNACQDGGALVVVDPLSQFYPPAATAMGIQFANTILLRPGVSDPNELYWAIDQALRCEAVGAVWGALETIGERWFRRFQLSAESSGAVGVFVRPAAAVHAPSWSEIQWLLKPRTSGNTPDARVCELKLHRCRGGQTGGRVRVEIDTVTGEIRGHRIPASHRLSTNQRTSESITDRSQEGTCHEKMPLRSSAQLAHPATCRPAAGA